MASSTIIAKGDLVNSSSAGKAEVVDDASDNDTFIGVSANQSLDGDTQNIDVYARCIIRGRLAAAATTYIGYGLIYSAGPGSSGSHTGTDSWAFANDASGGGDVIAWARENVTSGTGPFKIIIDSFMVGAGIGAGGGFWEGAAA